MNRCYITVQNELRITSHLPRCAAGHPLHAAGHYMPRPIVIGSCDSTAAWLIYIDREIVVLSRKADLWSIPSSATAAAATGLQQLSVGLTTMRLLKAHYGDGAMPAQVCEQFRLETSIRVWTTDTADLSVLLTWCARQNRLTALCWQVKPHVGIGPVAVKMMTIQTPYHVICVLVLVTGLADQIL